MTDDRPTRDPRLQCGMNTPWGCVRTIDYESGVVGLGGDLDDFDCRHYSHKPVADVLAWLDTQYVAIGDEDEDEDEDSCTVYPPKMVGLCAAYGLDAKSVAKVLGHLESSGIVKFVAQSDDELTMGDAP